jgi:uncharacterized phage protein (TIGR02220 family)
MSSKIVQRFIFGESIPNDAVFLFYDKENSKPLAYEVPLKAEKKAKEETINQINNTIEAVVKYLNDKTGSKYTTKAKATTALIRARINEGRSFDDFKCVIDTKYLDWGDDPKWSKYLRPETLFGSKFDGYLSQKGPGEMNDDIFSELDSYLEKIEG